MKLVEQVKAARRVSVPLVAVNTPDPAATIEALCQGINGDSPKVQWDIVRNYAPLNTEGREAMKHLDLDQTAYPTGALSQAVNLPEKTVVFLHLSNRWMSEAAFVQAVWNLRDVFKQDRRMLVLLGPNLELPPELANDVVVFDEPLPDEAAIATIVANVANDAGVDVAAVDCRKAVEAVQGLPAFQIEQLTAMSLSKEGIDTDALWERKRRQIEQTPGLTVYKGGDAFSAIGGVEQVKEYCKRIVTGRRKPSAIVWLDEIEKAMAGAGGDTSGVSQDFLGQLLTYLQDHECRGMIFLGPPGCAKSAVAKAVGNEAGIPTVRLDLGGMKGSLVGQSEQQLRNALKVITSVSNDNSLWIATCNSVANLDTALLRRFPKVFYFDLPDATERQAIWNIWTARHGIYEPDAVVDDAGWVGANIAKCCEEAADMECSIAEAARYVIPVGRSAASEIENLRKQADGKFLSASYEGAYCRTPDAKTRRRAMTDL